ncbi:hypothetical protein [Nocardia sp. NPDC057353]|uniref:hypothetical protein n=1 Tax=Nocardia sp. NPDC057353 TaxID=3346104 RepID=UPI003637F22B
MNTTGKIITFAGGLAAVFALALGVGAAVGPEPATEPGPHDTHDSGPAPVASGPGGLLTTDQGYTLRLDSALATATTPSTLSFQILDASGAPLTRYTRSHDKDLHLILVRRDLAAFQHVHPTLDATGTWSVPVDLSRAGDYRVFADFTPDGGPNLTLRTDLRVSGNYDPQPLAAPASTATIGDYTVTLDGAIVPGQASRVRLSVERGRAPVTDLQPYLGAYGHLVALRATDLAYLHVHPEGQPGDGSTPAGPGIDFVVEAPTAGDYRLFLDFQHAGVVRTAQFTVSVGADPATPAPTTSTQPEQPGHGH